MLNIKKITDLLDNFDEQSQKSLELFLVSPLFNKRDEMVKLNKYFKKLRLQKDTKISLTGRVVFRKIFPKQSYSEVKLNKLLANFIKLLEQFVIHYRLMINSNKQEFELMNFYEESALYVPFNKLLDRSQMVYEEKKIKTSEDYQHLYELSLKTYKYYAITNAFNNNEETKQEVLSEALQLLDIYYLINKLRMTAHFFNQQTIINKSFTIVLLNEILEQIENSKFLSVPLINAYYHCLMFLKDQSNETNYNALQKLLDAGTFEDNEEDEKILYDFALNYCALQINAGESEYYSKLFQLYKLALKRESSYIDGYLFTDTVKNIVTVALRLKELSWAEEFLIKYKGKFNPDAREDIYNYSMARLKFSEKDFDSALDFLNNAEYKVPFFKISAKILLIKIYYEKSEIDVLEYEISALYMFIYRNENISDQYSALYRAFIAVTKKLISTPKSEKEKFKKLLIKIENTDHLAERIWLKEKVEERL